MAFTNMDNLKSRLKSSLYQGILIVIIGSLLSACGSVWTRRDARFYFEDPHVIALCEAAKVGDTEKIDNLLAQGADINQVGKRDYNPLYWLLVMNRDTPEKKKGFRHLLERGADALHLDEKDFMTPLHISARHEDPEYLKAILEIQPEINVNFQLPNTNWDTPLLQAILVDRVNNLELLIESGANLDQVNSRGETPLLMTKAGSWEAASVLLMNGADYNAEVATGEKTIVWWLENSMYDPQVAIKNDGIDYRQKVVDFLREKGVEVDPWMPGDENPYERRKRELQHTQIR